MSKIKSNKTMKKIVAATVICILTLASVSAHTLSEKEAKQFLDNAWRFVKANDSTSFMNLWSLNDSLSVNQKRPHNQKEILESFRAVRQWIDTALKRNLAIDHITVDKQNLEGTDTEYWVRAWFKYDEHNFKGFGFYLANMNGKWIVRDYPSTSTKEKDAKEQK
jgi:hypothetical protein